MSFNHYFVYYDLHLQISFPFRLNRVRSEYIILLLLFIVWTRCTDKEAYIIYDHCEIFKHSSLNGFKHVLINMFIVNTRFCRNLKVFKSVPCFGSRMWNDFTISLFIRSISHKLKRNFFFLAEHKEECFNWFCPCNGGWYHWPHWLLLWGHTQKKRHFQNTF